jgi:hypothetical protein
METTTAESDATNVSSGMILRTMDPLMIKNSSNRWGLGLTIKEFSSLANYSDNDILDSL